MADKVDIAVVTKTYQGVEGRRVKAGTRFAVGKDLDGMATISLARYQTLLRNKLVRPFGDKDRKPTPVARPLERPQTRMEGVGGPTARAERAASRARTRQPDEPATPRQIKGPSNGSQTGPAASSASSPEGQASAKSPSTSRGTRSSASSRSTTPAR